MIVLKSCLIRIIITNALFSPFAVGTCKWRSLQRTARYSLENISRSPNTSLISDTFTADTKRSCAYGCAEKRRYSLYYVKSTQTCHCNQGRDSNMDIITPAANDVFYGETESCLEELEDGYTWVYTWPPPRDCLQYYQNGFTMDGVYNIQPVGGAPVDTWCDMTNGGWTVFQRRQDGSENFFRNWDDYVKGFGDRCSEYWLGLENIHLLTKEPSELNVSLVTYGDVTPISAYAYHSTFSIGNSSTKYKLTVQGFTGDCGDGLTAHSGYMFSTKDNDNDASGSNCAQSYKGGWWYTACHRSNLNGLYLEGNHTSYANGVDWKMCWGYHYSLKETVMKVRRL